MKLTGAQMVCESLLREGVEVVFGLPGGAILPFYQTLPEYPALQHVLVRHEQNAGHAADAYSRASGNVGVCVATSGPAATNLVTPLATAMMDSVPMIAITGQVPRTAIGRDAFQETDTTGITLPITKHNYLVMDTADLPRVIKEAFHIARTGRPGPVLIDLPRDVLEESAEFDYPEQAHIPSYKPTLEGSAPQVRKAAKAIARAKRPLLLAGHGVLISGATGELRALAERAQIPVIETLLGIGSFPGDHVLYLGWPGMHGQALCNYAIDQADLLVAVGMRFDDRVTGKISTFAPNAEVIHIDIDPAELGKNVRVDVPIVGDARRVLHALNREVEQAARPEWLADLERLRADHPQRLPDGARLTGQAVVAELCAMTEGRATVVTGVGQHQMWAAQHYRFREPDRWLTSGGLGTMGYEVPGAMGAAFARPGEQVWSIGGDGGFQMTLSELATVAEHRLPVRFIILNNNQLGMVRQLQDLFYERQRVAVAYTGNPDFVALAGAYGIWAQRVDTPAGVRAALEAAAAVDGPALLDFRIEPDENVYPHVPAGGSVAEMIEAPAFEGARR
ncbi:MAG: biosynthetic-type acetolactate synthase large subunit [Chloroflexota bacterium]